MLRLSDGVQKVICPDIDICDAITRHMLVPGAQKEYIAQTNESAIVSAKRIAAKAGTLFDIILMFEDGDLS